METCLHGKQRKLVVDHCWEMWHFLSPAPFLSETELNSTFSGLNRILLHKLFDFHRFDWLNWRCALEESDVLLSSTALERWITRCPKLLLTGSRPQTWNDFTRLINLWQRSEATLWHASATAADAADHLETPSAPPSLCRSINLSNFPELMGGNVHPDRLMARAGGRSPGVYSPSFSGLLVSEPNPSTVFLSLAQMKSFVP